MTDEKSSCAECNTFLSEAQDRVVTADATFCRSCYENLSAQVRYVVDAQCLRQEVTATNHQLESAAIVPCPP